MIMLHNYAGGVCVRCGKADDGVRPQACSGRSRADASARARRAAQTLIEEIGADGPVSVEEVAQKAVQEIRALRLQLVEARAALEESEHSMHLRIRAGYDRTVADSWRKKVAEVEAERNEARAEVARREREHSALLETAQKALASTEAERDEARTEVERLKAHFILIAQACGNEDPDTAHHAVRARVAERDAAVAKAAAYERDWYDAKSEFGTATAKLRERVRVVERERDEARKEAERTQRLLDHATQSNPGTSTLVMLMNEAREARAEASALRAHFDAAAPEHNLPALLDLYDNRRAAAESERDQAWAEVERLRVALSQAQRADE